MIVDIREKVRITGYSFTDSYNDCVSMSLVLYSEGEKEGRVGFRWDGYESFNDVFLDRKELENLSILVQKTLALLNDSPDTEDYA